MSVLGFIGALASVGLGVYNTIQGGRSQREINAMNQANFERQLEFNSNMVNQQNEFNSPGSLKQRYIEAGLNPHLALMKGSPTTSAITSAPTAPTLQNPFRSVDPSILMSVANLALSAKSIDNESKRVEIESYKADTDRMRAESTIGVDSVTLEEKRAIIDSITSNIEIAKNDFELRKKEYEMRSLSYQQDFDYKEVYYPLSLVYQDLQNKELRQSLQHNEISLALQQVMNGAKVSEITSQVKLNEQQFNHFRAVEDLIIQAKSLGVVIQGQSIDLNNEGLKRVKEDNRDFRKTVRDITAVTSIIGNLVSPVTQLSPLFNNK